MSIQSEYYANNAKQSFSGKTLTSFKTAQILMKLPNAHKVVFVVDRKDLDYQTTKEFNSFSAGSVDGTDSTHALVKQFNDDTRLIVTTDAISDDNVLKFSVELCRMRFLIDFGMTKKTKHLINYVKRNSSINQRSKRW